jgi:hypothetical protein
MRRIGLHVALAAMLVFALTGCDEQPGQQQPDQQQPQQQQPGTQQQDTTPEQDEQLEEGTYTVQLQPLNDSGISGEATVTVTGNTVRVELQADGVTANEYYPIYIYGFGDAQGVTPPDGQQDTPGQQDTTPGAPGQDDQQNGLGSPGQQEGQLQQDQDQNGLPGQQDQDQNGLPGQQGQDQNGMPGQQDTTPGAPGEDQNGLLGQQQDDELADWGPLLALTPIPQAEGTTLVFEGTLQDVDFLAPVDELGILITGMQQNGEFDLNMPAASGEMEQAEEDNGMQQQETTPGAPGEETTPNGGMDQDGTGGGLQDGTEGGTGGGTGGS